MTYHSVYCTIRLLGTASTCKNHTRSTWLRTAGVVTNAIVYTVQQVSHSLKSRPSAIHFTTFVIKLFHFLHSEPEFVGYVIDRFVNAVECLPVS